MKTAEDYKKFDINQMTPYNRMLQLKQYKAQAANEEYARDVSNTMGALSNAASIGMTASNPMPGGGNVGGAGANFGTNYGQYGGNVDFSKYGVSMPKQTGFKSQFGKKYNTGG